MVGWHHRLNGHELEQIPGGDGGQGSLVCCSPWLQSPSAVILKHKKIKSVTVSIVSPSICHEMMGPDAMILVF